MALIPSISLSLNNTCNKVTLTETTGLYVVNTNEGGWGTPNINTSVITVSIVNIYNYTGLTLLGSYTLTGLYPSATPSEFEILSEAPWTHIDGIYQIKYIITDNSITPVNYYSDTTHELFLCNLCNCKDKLILKLVKSCDSEKAEKLKQQVDQLELFIYGIQAAFSCADFTTANTILAKATIYCETVSNCGCNC